MLSYMFANKVGQKLREGPLPVVVKDDKKFCNMEDFVLTIRLELVK